MIAAPASAQTYSILYSFTGGTDGGWPFAGMAYDADGNLYGTTGFGGDLTCVPPLGCGTVFKLDPTGKLTTLHTFNGADGELPSGPLLRDSAGNLFGTTQLGGPFGAGTLFRVDAAGTFTLLHSFKPAKGMTPYAGVIEDSRGFLYGATYNGGAFQDGLIYELNPANGQFKTLHSFAGFGNADGQAPYGNLIFDGKGGLIGTTSYGGGGCDCGSVFTIDKDGNETLLYAFHNDDGAHPFAPVIRDNAGNLYGTTGNGGDFSCDPLGCGVIFKLTPAGAITVLQRFSGSDGADPNSGLLRDSQGIFYGMTQQGGNKGCPSNPKGCGVIYKFDSSRTITVLHAFSNGNGEGFNPEANLAFDGTGSLIGTANEGGAFGFGIVFRLTP